MNPDSKKDLNRFINKHINPARNFNKILRETHKKLKKLDKQVVEAMAYDPEIFKINHRLQKGGLVDQCEVNVATAKRILPTQSITDSEESSEVSLDFDFVGSDDGF